MAWLNTLLLKSPNPRTRCKAVDNLSRSTRPSDTELLFASLHDESPQVRCAAVRALARANTQDSIKSLVSALRDPSFEVREASARALGRLGAFSAAEALACCLMDPDAAVRIAAAGALRAMNWKPSTREQSAWFDIALGNTSVAPATVTVPQDEGAVRDRDTAFYRHMAAAAHKERLDPARITSLLHALHGPDLLGRVSAIHDLGELDDPQITRELVALFRDREPEVRLAVAKVLATRDDSPAAHFVGLLQDSSCEVRATAVKFLSRIRHMHLIELLLPLLSDPCLPVRQATATALGQIGSAAAVAALEGCLADPDEKMREAVERALEEVDPALRTPAQSSTCMPSSTTRLAGIR